MHSTDVDIGGDGSRRLTLPLFKVFHTNSLSCSVLTSAPTSFTTPWIHLNTSCESQIKNRQSADIHFGVSQWWRSHDLMLSHRNSPHLCRYTVRTIMRKLEVIFTHYAPRHVRFQSWWERANGERYGRLWPGLQVHAVGQLVHSFQLPPKGKDQTVHCPPGSTTGYDNNWSSAWSIWTWYVIVAGKNGS